MAQADHADNPSLPEEDDFDDASEGDMEATGRIVHALLEYKNDAYWEVKRWEYNYSRLSEPHQRLLPNQPAKCEAARRCIDINDLFFRQMIRASVGQTEDGANLLVAGAMAAVQRRKAAGVRVSPMDSEKCRYVLKNLVREWGEEGAPEREQSYGRILAELQAHFPVSRLAEGLPPLRVLIPGAGLGRLCLDIAKLGLQAEGNEFSYYMLMASSFILNHCERAGQWTLFPYVLATCNQPSDADQLRPVAVPDVLPGEGLPGPGLLATCGGDFVEVYGAAERAAAFDCVATCFFLDTARNVIAYMETIRHTLKEGGLWINLGPLLYHWADAHTYLPGNEHSVELPLEDVERVAAELGFVTLQRCLVTAGFNANARSMQLSAYNCVFWTMRKGSSSPQQGS